MLYEFLVFLFAVLCFILIFLILVQKGKSSMGLGSMGGGSQMLFGGSGGQDIFQKATWILGATFMAGSLLLAIIKRPTGTGFLQKAAAQQTVPNIPVPQQPQTK